MRGTLTESQSHVTSINITGLLLAIIMSVEPQARVMVIPSLQYLTKHEPSQVRLTLLTLLHGSGCDCWSQSSLLVPCMDCTHRNQQHLLTPTIH